MGLVRARSQTRLIFGWALIVSLGAVLLQGLGGEPATIGICLSLAGLLTMRGFFKEARQLGDRLVSQLATKAECFQKGSRRHESQYQIARGFYYLGMLTVSQTIVRIQGLTASDILFALACWSLICETPWATGGRASLPWELWLGLALLIAGELLSSLCARDPAVCVLETGKTVYVIGLWLWLGTVVLRNEEQVAIAMACWLVSCAASGLAAVAEMALGVGAGIGAIAGGRAMGLTEHVNELGMVEAMALLPAIIRASDARGFCRQALGGLGVALIAAGLMLSVSIAALAGLVAAALVWVLGFMDLNSITGKRGLVLVGAVALVIYVCFAQFKFLERLPNFANRLARIQEAAGTAYTVETRFRSYSNAWSRIQEDPLIGVGPDPTRAKAYGGWQVHNILLLQWYESGLLALIGMSVILTSIAKTCWLSLKNSQSYQQFRMSLSLLLSFVAFGVNTMAMPEVHHRDAWVFAALPLALASAGPWRSLPAKVGG